MDQDPSAIGCETLAVLRRQGFQPAGRVRRDVPWCRWCFRFRLRDGDRDRGSGGRNWRHHRWDLVPGELGSGWREGSQPHAASRGVRVFGGSPAGLLRCFRDPIRADPYARVW